MAVRNYPALHLYSLCCFVLFSLFLFVVLSYLFIFYIFLFFYFLFICFLYHMHYAFQETNLYFMEISSYNLVS